MKLIRFFLSNLILIAFFCAVIYVYVYRDNLLGESTPAGHAVAYVTKQFPSVGAFINGIKVKQNEEKDITTPTTPVAVSVEPETSLVANDKANDESTIVASAETDSAIQEDVFVTPEIEQSLNQAVDQQANNQSGITTVVTESNTVKESNEQENANKIEDTTKAVWIDAREAFYKRDYTASISAYEHLIASTTDNYDAYGELGNVYFNQGKKVEAAAAYFEAASVLVKIGNQRRADSMLPLLNYLDPAKAEQLKVLLSASQS